MNWTFMVECIDCKHRFTIKAVNASSEVIGRKRARIVTVGVPNECPRCHNIRVVSMPPPPSDHDPECA